jgi:hypothetical protein
VKGPNSYLIALKLSMQCPLLIVKVGLRQGSVLEIKGLKLVESGRIRICNRRYNFNTWLNLFLNWEGCIMTKMASLRQLTCVENLVTSVCRPTWNPCSVTWNFCMYLLSSGYRTEKTFISLTGWRKFRMQTDYEAWSSAKWYSKTLFPHCVKHTWCPLEWLAF